MIKKQWQLYAQAWSMPNKERRQRLAEVATADVVYADPSTTITGVLAFSEHMAEFQKQMPGGRFEITEAFEHHEQSLAHWHMLAADGSIVMKGSSFSRLAENGQFASFTGFFSGN